MHRLTTVLLMILLLVGCGRQSTPTSDILLIKGGTILTMTEAQPVVEAMAVQDGKVLGLGTAAYLTEKYPDAETQDLAGAVLLPGFIDSHVHVHELGRDRLKADLTGVESVAQMVERLRAFYPNPKPGEWLRAQGWDEGVWGSKGYPDRAELDTAFPDNPIHLESLHGFAGFYNGKALEAAGIDTATPDPKVGTILRREDGTPTGVMLTLAQGLVNKHIPADTPETTRDAIVAGLQTMAAAGVTSVHEAGMDSERLQAFRDLADAGKLPVRVYGMLNGNDEALMDQWFASGPLIDPNAFFSVRSIKVFYDGSLGSRTALLAEPYTDKPNEAEPTERISPEAVTGLAERAAARGFQMAVHAIGDEGNNRVMNLYEASLKPYPDLDHRWRIEHAQVVLPDYYARAAELGVISSMQSSHAVGDSKWAEDRLGPERIQHAYAWRKILAAGAPLIINSDLPGEPWEPAITLYFAVTRADLKGNPPGGWYASEALTVMETLAAMTIDSARAAFQEDQIGSLAPGKFADYVILDRDPRKVPPAELKDLRVLETRVNGKKVFGE
ncbi:MAG: amidohydrolase [Acidobacteriota bacterium]|nr:amidohydrolase [Acidobacteriota bacterium]